MTRVLVVPAAGRGARLGRSMPKALVPLLGTPLLLHVLRRFAGLCARAVVIIHPSAAASMHALRATAPMPIMFAEQPEPTGMLDAILLARDAVVSSQADRAWICWCDQVLLSERTVGDIAAAEKDAATPAAIFPIATVSSPYIHFDRRPDGRISGVRQRREGDVMPAVGDTDAGVFDLSIRSYEHDLPQFASGAAADRGTGERNFLPFLPWLAARAPVVTTDVANAIEVRGINTPEDFAAAEAYLRSTDHGTAP
jgi:bifunctional N-acetylglucosamine-1-phosphate-uridyltransferase/glucosamine-1-phosphate-acetyltransferase GlmU-like protein